MHSTGVDILRAGFEEKSKEEIVRGYTGCLDGMLQPINCPCINDCNDNQRDYHSRHYTGHDLNVQTVCHARLHFTMFNVASPGRMVDVVVFSHTDLQGILDELRTDEYIVVDATYALSDKMITPSTGSQRDDPTKNMFNYYLSKLRIRIEMTFGFLQNKWRILLLPLPYKLQKSTQILHAAAKFHSFVINSDYEGGKVLLEDDKVVVARAFNPPHHLFNYLLKFHPSLKLKPQL